MPARPETIRFVKERRDGDLAMVAFEYVDVQDRAWEGWVGVRLTDGVWRVTGGASGSAGNQPRSPAPWANLGSTWSERLSMAGGRVHGEGIVRARLVSTSGAAVEDSVDDGIALLLAPGPFPRPWTVELYDASGALLGSHPYPRRPA